MKKHSVKTIMQGLSDILEDGSMMVEETTNGTSILFDMTPPDDFELDTVFVSGGKVIFGFWNASNDTLTLRVPIPEDVETLIGGTFQSQARFGEGAYVKDWNHWEYIDNTGEKIKKKDGN